MFRDWADLVERGLVTRDILRYWHSRLTVGHEFEPGTDVEQMRLLVDDRLGIDQSDMWPDFPPSDPPESGELGDRRDW